MQNGGNVKLFLIIFLLSFGPKGKGKGEKEGLKLMTLWSPTNYATPGLTSSFDAYKNVHNVMKHT